MQRTPSPNKTDPSTPILSISIDDSDDNIPITLLKRKKQQKSETPPKRRRTRASVKEAAISATAPILKEASRKRKIPEFPASLPNRRAQSSVAAKSPSPTFPSSPPIMLRTRIPTSPKHSPPSPFGAEMQSVHSFVTLFSEVVVTQEPAARKSKADTQGNIGQVAPTQETLPHQVTHKNHLLGV